MVSSTVLPSAFAVRKFAGGPALVAYAAVAAVAAVLLPRISRGLSHRACVGASLTLLLMLTLIFAVVYPVANTHEPGRGSDDDDALNLGVRTLLELRSPYTERTYLCNELHQLPGAFLLAAPFVLLGSSAMQNVFWLAVFWWVACIDFGPRRSTSLLAALSLLAPVVVHQVATGTGHLSNAIYVLLGLWWLVRTEHQRAAAVALGVVLASRPNFAFLMPLVWGLQVRRQGLVATLQWSGITIAVVAVLCLPFYLRDPAGFTPLWAVDRLARFEALIPHAGWVLGGGLGILSTILAFWTRHVAELWANSAWVIAFPVLAGWLLTSIADRSLDLEYLTYGSFALPFALFALWSRIPAR